MSYYFPFHHFSNGQANIIRQAFASSSLLQQVVSNSCAIPKIDGLSTICNSNNTYSLTNGGNNVTWQISTNLQIISSNNTGITVTPINSSTREKGYIRAILGSQTIEKKVWIGKPNIYTFNSNGTKDYFGQSYSYPVSHSTREIEVHTDTPNTSFSWDVFPNNLTWGSHGGKITFYINIEGNYVITAKATNECGEFIQFYTLNVGKSGIEPDFKITPNPTSDNFTINNKNQRLELSSTNEEEVIYELYDLNYSLKLKGNLKESRNINVSSLKKGLYILKILSKAKTEHHRLIIK